uniref:Uncharacterized protein n=1 Tax=Cyanoderma ruficeps TaxID=181631 RepID=A0A8C3QK11_9PASS
MLTLSSKSPFPPFPALVFHGLHTLALLDFPSCKPNLQAFLCSKITTKPGFILVHLNIHDSSHFCSKRHLFI